MNFAEKIKAFVSMQTTETTPYDYTPLDFVKTRKGILKELVLSKQSGKLIGVYSRVLGEGMFLTCVEAIQPHGKDEQIVFHRYDMSGKMLARTRISIDEIHMVCPFNKLFRSPALDTARADSVLLGVL
ncbi:hypothetical protein KK083_21795 [Fulvivirgaceae bacterium PWU4]|uniref:Uncharacterized protein n=1 Tax=Chryseosolibacter histidini TaxID=2782349 RepID=A0AAP2GRG0_9BACT|nr:hypothetical protein [Chryseosolibacter histidini]MBT1699547.1 hypothetical protein [Chryseosolibacter histidini]